MPTTEVLTVPLKPGSDIGDPSNEAAAVVKDVCDKLSSTNGVQQIHFGMQVEKPEVFRLVVTWDELKSHQAFMATEGYQPFVQRFLTIVEGTPEIFHAELDPESEALEVLNAPVTEFATWVFGPSGAPETYLAGVHSFRNAVEDAHIGGMHGSAIGFAHEEIERKGVKGKSALLIAGYSNLEAHTALSETEVFKQNVGLLGAGAQQSELHHAQLLKFAAVQ